MLSLCFVLMPFGKKPIAAGAALAAVRESFEPKTTARNLRLIREAREKRGIDVNWITNIEGTLLNIK